MTKPEKYQREALLRAYAEYERDWSDTACPITDDEKSAYESGFEDAWKAAQQADEKLIRELVLALEVAAQTIREVQGAQNNGAKWYTNTDRGLYQQVRMWTDKGSKAVHEALSQAQSRLGNEAPFETSNPNSATE